MDSTQQQKMEPLLVDTGRETIRPLDPRYKPIWDSYKKQQGSFWVPEEIDLSQDSRDWENLDEDSKHFLSHVLAFFAVSDEVVSKNLSERFIPEIKIPEATHAYSYQGTMENIHSETYSLFIETLVPEKTERDRLFNAVNNMPVVSDKTKWAEKWISSEEPFAVRLIAFACVEGIFFSGSFCAIDYIKQKKLFPGLCFANDFIARDEAMHTELACIMYTFINNKVDIEKFQSIVEEAVKVEKTFVCDALPVSLIGMNKDLMCTHIEYCANILARELGYEEIYPNSTKCPFPFMKNRTLEQKVNFFEHKVSEYKKFGALTKKEDMAFEISDDF